LGIVPRDWSDHRAALDGHDTEDVCTLIFAGSGPGHALATDAIVAGAHACWQRFTARPAGAAGGSVTNPAAAQATAAEGSRAASGSVGLAALLALADVARELTRR
jgi:hypothetical protein